MTRDSSRLSTLRRWTGTDTDTVGDSDLALNARRSRRDRRAATSTVAAIAARGVALLTSLIAIPLTIGFLGIERYGVFVALTSLTSMLVFADFGLGNGLLNLVSDAQGRNDRDTARRAVSSAFLMLTVVAILLLLVFLVAYPLVPWAAAFRVSTRPAIDEVGPTAAILIGLFLIALPLGITERIRMAYQEGFISSIATIAGGVLGLAGLIVAIVVRAGLPELVLATSIAPLLALAGNGYRLFRHDRRWLIPTWRLADRRTAFRLARLGFLFFVLQLAVAVAYQSDVLVAATVLGPGAAATYAVTLKVFMVVPTLIALYLATLWPAYTEALGRGDYDWVRRTLRRSLTISFLVSSAASLMLVVVGSWLIGSWTGGTVDAPVALLIGAGLWAVTSATFNAIAILLNAASVVLFQVVIASVMAIGSIGLSILLAKAVGLSGVVWGTLLAYLLLAAIPTALYTPRLLARLRRAALTGRDWAE